MAAKCETTWFDVRDCERETEKAVWVEIDGNKIWLPKSQLKARKKDKSGRLVRVEVLTWWAKKAGLRSSSDAPYAAPAGDKILWVAVQELVDETFTVYVLRIAGRDFEVPKSEVLERKPLDGPTIHRLCIKRSWAEENGLLDPKDDL
jgi:hypothetical protein